jgi:thiol-disulfide isomerase/thioredoxin
MIAWLMSLASFFALNQSYSVSEISLEQLQQAHVKQNDTLYVVNFWATWCKPCVAEMPFFEKAAETFNNQKVKIVFVSLNYPREIEAVDKFVKQKNIHLPCYVLNGGNPNVWIDKIEKEWSGSIPATVMYKGGKKVYFREGDFTQTELDSIIKTNLQ